MGVQVLVHTGTRSDAHQTFFCTKVRGRGGGGEGESKQIFREYEFKKTSKITDDPLELIFTLSAVVPLAQTRRIIFGIRPFPWELDNLLD